MKRNGPFTIRSSSVRGPCVFVVRFESVLIKYYYIRTALSALARGSLWFLLKSATRSRSLNHALSLRTFFLLFLATLSQNCTAGHGFRLDLDFFTRAGVRRYLNSNGNNLKKLNYTHVRMCDVHKTERAVHGPFSARLWSVQYPFESRLTSVWLKRSGVKREGFFAVYCTYTRTIQHHIFEVHNCRVWHRISKIKLR